MSPGRAPVVGRSGRGVCNAVADRGAVLLESVLALALIVAAGVTVLGVVRTAQAQAEAARVRAQLTDLACSTLAAMDLGLGTGSSLSGASSGDVLAGPVGEAGAFTVEVSTEPVPGGSSGVFGLRVVEVTASGFGQAVTLREVQATGVDAAGVGATGGAR